MYVQSDIHCLVAAIDKPLVWLRGEVKTPPFSQAARVEAGVLLRQLQSSAKLGLPHSRPMPRIGARCHELRIVDEGATWRIINRASPRWRLPIPVYPSIFSSGRCSGLGHDLATLRKRCARAGRSRPSDVASDYLRRTYDFPFRDVPSPD